MVEWGTGAMNPQRARKHTARNTRLSVFGFGQDQLQVFGSNQGGWKWSEMRRAIPLIALTFGWISFVPMLALAATARIFGNPNVLQRAPSRAYHVENYKLTLHFDQSKGEVFGDELVTLRPLKANFSRFYLDSSELKIGAVTLQQPGVKPLTLKFKPEDSRLWITLDHAYGPSNDLHVHIVYHGFPRTGLFFVRPNADYPGWPKEIWSQGEPEFNHFWFPCWDYPNDMSASETVTTVPDGQSVVSNGKLIKVTHHAGQTTYDWLESIPHSSYLISIAVGPWRKVSDRYRNIPVDYYVPEQVDEATARRSFHQTPDMLGFFSDATGVMYPYEQYAQVAVHNYLFGGMENVSATTLTDWTLHDERADPDYSSQGLVAHELGQHWFGDLVQGSDWGNIWLNEGFATYMEALYTQYHEGNDAFRFEMMDDQMKVQQQDREDYRRPIVDFHYAYPLQMFDSITHEKGAVVLDMLRNVLDDTQAASKPASQSEPLFKALKAYLTTYRGQAVGTAYLIKTIEAATGKNLDWFFHEWVYMAGHPNYKVEAKYDPKKRLEAITVLQTQQTDALTPIFDMPIELAFYGDHGASKHILIHDHQQTQRFSIPLDFKPRWIDFDPDGIIDKTVQFDQPMDAVIAKAENDRAMMSRVLAVEQLGEVKGIETGPATAVLIHVLNNDAFYGVRCVAATSLGKVHTKAAKNALVAALRQPDNRVRAAAVQALSDFRSDQFVYATLVQTLRTDVSYAVEAAAAEGLGTSGDPGAFSALQGAAKTVEDPRVIGAIFAGLAATHDPRAVQILFAYARPGVPERLRLSALGAIGKIGRSMAKDNKPMLVDIVRAALHDPFLSIQLAAEQLVGACGLNEFRALVQTRAQTAPTAFQRDSAQKALGQLREM